APFPGNGTGGLPAGLTVNADQPILGLPCRDDDPRADVFNSVGDRLDRLCRLPAQLLQIQRLEDLRRLGHFHRGPPTQTGEVVRHGDVDQGAAVEQFRDLQLDLQQGQGLVDVLEPVVTAGDPRPGAFRLGPDRHADAFVGVAVDIPEVVGVLLAV